MYWELRLKEKHKRLSGSTLSAHLDDLHGPTGTGVTLNHASRPENCFVLVIGSVEKILIKQAMSDKYTFINLLLIFSLDQRA